MKRAASFLVVRVIGSLVLGVVLLSRAAGLLSAQPNNGNQSAVLDGNSSTVTWVEPLTNDVTGQVTQKAHGYVAVATGLNYQDDTGQWQASHDLIELTEDGGAAALHGPHKVSFNANLNTVGAISIATVSNRVLRTHILGLYYFDPGSGESVLIAPVQDSIGVYYPPNQIVFPDALGGSGGNLASLPGPDHGLP